MAETDQNPFEDELAPVDYTAVHSVAEGTRALRAKGMHPSEEDAAAKKPALPRKLPSALDGLPPAMRVAYPDADEIPEDPFHPVKRVEAEEAAQPRRRSERSRAAATEPVLRTTTPDLPATGARIAMPRERVAEPVAQPAFDAPVPPPVPEWLRVAQQNNMPLQERAASPRVQAAPRIAEEEPERDVLGRPIRRTAPIPQPAPATAAEQYAQAGYPPELVQRQRELEGAAKADPPRRRHGAQYAVPEQAPPPMARGYGERRPTAQSALPPRQSATRYPQQNVQNQPAYSEEPRFAPAPARPMPSDENPYRIVTDDDWEDEESDLAPAYRERAPFPWLGAGMFLAAFIAVGLWILQLTFTAQAEQILQERREANEALLTSHPYRYEELIEREAQKNNLHPAFVAAIVLNESSFDPSAESRVGARGLMQVMDETAQFIYEKINGTTEGYSFDALYTAETNVQFGCWYLSYLADRFRGDPVLVAAAYHAGPNEVQNWLNSSAYSTDNLTIELQNMMEGPTRTYTTRVLSDYATYRRLYYETTEENQ